MRGVYSKYTRCLKRRGPFSLCRDFVADKSGSPMIYTGLIVAVLFGFGGLAVDAGMWYATKRSAQSAADAAALAGALEVARGSTATEIETRAKADAESNGYSSGSGATIIINNPPTSGPSAGQAGAVEAIVQQPVASFLSAAFRSKQVTVAARAVASYRIAESCVYVMDPSEDAALSVPGTADVDMDCGAQVNSVSPIAIDQVGASCMTATSLATAGGASGTCLDPQPDEDMSQVEDPFAYLTAPAAAAGPCDYASLVTVSSPTTLDPGNYCGGLKITKDVDFNPGEYVIGGEGLHIQGNCDVTGDEVTFYFPDTVTGYDPGPSALYIAGTADVQLSAPTTGDYQGLLFYLDQNIDPDLDIILQGGADMELEGVIYGINNHMRFAGGSDGIDGWVVIVVDTIEFTGNSNIAGATTPMDLPLALIQPTLVE